ncbi:zinc finger, CCHC-type containing LTR copia-type gag-polypeptide [Tanacetum coccineum]
MAETLGHTTSHAVWSALEDTYRHDSLERTHTLRDSLRHLKKGSSTVSDFSHKFKGICDQLQAIGHPLDEDDKSHWSDANLAEASKYIAYTIAPDWFVVTVAFSAYDIRYRHSKERNLQYMDRRRNGLYVLEQGQQAFLAKLSSKRIQASFELWHSRLGHVSQGH